MRNRSEKVVSDCVEIASGKTAWSEPAMRGSVIVAGDKLLSLTHEGALIAAEATPVAELSRIAGRGASTWTPPTLHGSQAFVRNADGFASCLDLR